jgi:glyoxylase-like metal-dependent hydrolase (beta-lactamase superfamily II)
MSEMISSLKRLKALKGDFKIFPGHGEGTTLETEKRQNMYLLRV